MTTSDFFGGRFGNTGEFANTSTPTASALTTTGNVLNPAPQTGQGAYGMVPGVLSMPNPAGDLSAQLPGLSTLNATASSDLQSKLGGTLSPGTQAALQNAAATYGVTSGMPGSQLTWNSLYGNIAGASEAQQQQGLQDYPSLTGAVSSTQTVSPALQTEIASTNATNAAAPNPAASASYAQQLFNEYLQAMRGPASGSQSSQGFQTGQEYSTPPGLFSDSDPYSVSSFTLPGNMSADDPMGLSTGYGEIYG